MHSLNFATLVRALSQATNRSLAGSRMFCHPDALSALPANFSSLAAVWGIRVVTDPDAASSCSIHLHAQYAEVEGERIDYAERRQLGELTAAEQIDRAYAGMPVTQQIADELLAEHTLEGERVAVSLIIEPKTAVLLLELQRAGAQVGVYATAAEVHQAVADELERRGVKVYANAAWTPDDEHAGALRLLDELQPTVIIDDGASFARLASLERRELLAQLKGVAEETTSGVRAFEAMEKAGALTYPVIASNDSQLKTGFDNVHGTGESCVTTFLNVLGDSWIDDSAARGEKMAVIGYGPVGRGFAVRMRSLGAHVVIVERSATAALKAQYDGFDVLPLAEAARACSCLISATGVVHTLDLVTLQSLNDGTVLGVIGGIANEIALDELTALTGQHIAPAVPLTQLQLDTSLDAGSDTASEGSRHAQLIASGDGMNYTVSGGNPIEIMDMSFAVQLNAVRMLVEGVDVSQGSDASRGTSGSQLPHAVIRLDAATDERIARSALKARGAQIDEQREMVTDWTRTRFSAPTTTPTTHTTPEEASHGEHA
ncbi:adenosylhomocysteinase [Alloscardovia macacae]|uniref:Adenosylhomocysteinase n=1 Tax=Alloscardovia macacae TaxID=1160091 RepID=A0A1Y2T3I3_9BIFI|nr:adenosylhomocysteinase [Alloscardovia macacae]OTA26964.1 adenosylhomocysteinase [Alloscardovia macacae]OTA30048.1 adenosylhomocysteinase [Alloscardovia macacae]